MTEQRELTLLERLKRELEKSEERNHAYREMVQQLTTPPADYGIVLKTGNKTSVEVPPTEEDFVKGSKVCIKPTALEKYDVKHPNGKILKVAGGAAVVRMVEQKNVSVQIEDLNLLEPKTEIIDTLTVLVGGSVVESLHPKGLELKAGESVTVSKMFGAVTGKAPSSTLGPVLMVKEAPVDGYCEVIDGQSTRMVFCGGVAGIEKGDNVVLDSSGMVVVRNNKAATTEYTVPTSINVSWDQIGGLNSVREQVYEMVELPHAKPEIFKYYNKKPAKGILLYGPPGCGKTLIAKAIATTLAGVYKTNLTDSGFIYVKGPEILNKYVGQSEETIRALFDRARRHKQKTGYPATLFIDEADAILSERGTGVSSDVDKTIVPMFLTEMDGLVDSSAFVILATNRADRLDPAVVREGRIDVKIQIPRPSEEACKDIAEINLKGTKVYGDSVEKLASVLARAVFESPLTKEVSGALIAGIVETAISKAIRRDLKSKGSPTGVTEEDVIESVLETSTRSKKMKSKEQTLEYARQQTNI